MSTAEETAPESAVVDTQLTATVGLNDEQRAAVEHGAGPLRIMAGAGTGKTKTLTARIVSLIERGLARPEDILALTFTNKAAGEMADRVGQALRARFPGAKRVSVQTYNAFGAQIVREQGHLLGLPAEPILLSEAERAMFLRTFVDDLPLDSFDLRRLGGRGGLLGQLLQFFDRWREEATADRDPDELVELYAAYAAAADEKKAGSKSPAVSAAKLALRRRQASDLIACARIYEERLIAVGALDFAAQISLAVKLLREHVDVRDAYRRRYPWLLVDEYQDTNHLQAVLVEALAGRDGNVTIVGDPDQSIYAFRGAARDSIVDFPRDFPGAKLLALSWNYRSTQPILDAANALIAADSERADRPPLRMADESKAAKVAQAAPVVVACLKAEREADEIAETIARLRRETLDADGSPRLTYRDFAILVRKNGVIADLTAALTAHGIPSYADSGARLFDCSETTGLLAYLRALVRPGTDVDLARAMLMPSFGLSEADILGLADSRRSDAAAGGARGPRRESLFEALTRRVAAEPTSPFTPFLTAFLGHRAQQFRRGASELIQTVMSAHGGSLTRRGRENFERLAELAREWVVRQPRLPWPTGGPSPLAAFCDYLGVLADHNESPAQATLPAGEDAVAIITAHAAKGLEWPVVFIARCNARDWGTGHNHGGGLFPPAWGHRGERTPAQLEADDDAEERRLFYVALTRAKERLYLTWAAEDEQHKKEVGAYPLITDFASHCTHFAPPGDGEGEEFILARAMLTSMTEFCQQHLAQPGPVDKAALRWDWELFWAKAAQEQPELTPPPCAADWLTRWEPDTTAATPLGWTPQATIDVPPDLPEVLSYTHLETYEECPARFNLAYVMRAPARPSYGGVDGTAIHRAVATAAERLQAGGALTREAVRDLIERELTAGRATPAAAPGSPVTPPAATVTAVAAELAATAETASSTAADGDLQQVVDAFLGVGTDVRPVGVELEFYAAIGGAVIHGFIDRLDPLPDGGCEIIDYKTHARAWSDAEAQRKLQIPLYILGARAIGHAARRGTLVFLRHGKRVAISPSEADLAAVEQRVADIVGRIKRREFPPQPGDHCRYCEHKDFCSEPSAPSL